jgi:RND family efflux transporter MFP subunit
LYASTTRIEQARSAIMRARSEIQAIEAKLRDAKSLAPFDGVIMNKMVEVGDTVQPGVPMLRFADITWLQVELNIPARLVTGLQEMMVLKKAATFDDYAEPVDVRVAQIYPMADAQRHTIKVKFDIPQGISQPGMYAKINIPDTSHAAETGSLPVIPATAIRYRGSLPVVYVQNEEGKAELRLIREGRRMSNGMVTVLSGLAPGDKVWVNPRPGMISGS